MISPSSFRKSLLRWYDKNKRALPWRKNTDPYRVLVSELMLQQTQVKTVLPYYEKFLRQFPTVKKLASAPEQAVLAAWAGLGYYRRARYLQAAAMRVAKTGFPSSAEGLRELPGIGEYTAAALGSISFGLPLPVVDGNVIRVIARLLALDEDAKSKPGLARINKAAAELLDPKRPGDFNQAMMELGALVCGPSSPDCAACPVSGHCRAFAMGKPEMYPRLPAAPKATQVRKAIALVQRGSQVLSAQRSTGGRMIGFWHFPEIEINPAVNAARSASVLAAGVVSGLRGKGTRCGTVRHTITRYRISAEAFRFNATGAPKAPWRWVAMAELKQFPLASAEKRLLAMLVSA